MNPGFAIALIIAGIIFILLLFTRTGREAIFDLIAFLFRSVWRVVGGIVMIAGGLILAYWILTSFL